MLRIKYCLSALKAGALLVPLLLSSEMLLASALPPCLKAVASKHGTSLLTIEQAEGTAPAVLKVYPRENWINDKDGFVAPATYWTDFLQWSVLLPAANISGPTSCPLPLVTDDGEFVVVISRDNLVGADWEALRIYRRRDHTGDPMRPGPDHGVFIRAIPFNEILPPEQIGARQAATDSTPAWFVGSTFDFSPDDRQLLITSKGRTLRIELGDGTVLSH